jgi:AAA family ATP:ADP antiporter
MSNRVDAEFGRFRSFLWPIHRQELRKIVPMLLMLFCICFNYTVLRNLKDAIVVTASGAEVIPFIKVWAMLPMAVILTLIFTKLSNRFNQDKVFCILITLFLTCFGLFAFVLYPMRESLHANTLADYLATVLPVGFKGLIAMVRNWSFTAFYVMAELWSSIVLTVLFWGFANQVTRLGEARRFYSVFSMCMNVATILAGQVAILCSEAVLQNYNFFLAGDSWEQTLKLLVAVMILSGIITMLVLRWLCSSVLTHDELNAHDRHKDGTVKTKKRLSLKESLTYVSNSTYLVCIAIIVVSYNLVINLVEVVWKAQVSNLYPAPADFNNYINNLTSLIGLVSTLFAFCMPKLMGRFGWTKTALITPVIMLVTSLGFFAFFLFSEQLGPYVLPFTAAGPLAIAVFFGSAQNCLSKAAKYSVFDGTKEMAYIPLSHECKIKGKAAIDGVGSRLGKSGGSVIHTGLLMLLGTLSASAPYVAAILLVVIILWIGAVRGLGRQFNDLVASQDHALTPEPPVAEPDSKPVYTAT